MNRRDADSSIDHHTAATKQHVSYGYPERYFDGDAQAFRYRIKRAETWFEGDQKMGRWEWEPWTGQVPGV